MRKGGEDMTAEELVRAALALKGETAETAEDYRGYALTALNIILAEMLPLENQLRYTRGETELSAAPELSTFSDPVPYDAQLVKTCAAYGLAAKLTIEDSNAPLFNYLNQMYAQAFSEGTPGKAERICDSVWGD